MIIPDKLKAGDSICLLSPSGTIRPEFLKGAELRLHSWGLNVLQSTYCSGQCGRFSGTTDERLSDLLFALSSPRIKAIFCSRGGYGAIHLLPYLQDQIIKDNPKWIIGYSDITALHMAWNRAGVISLHAPMARHLTEEPDKDPATAALKRLLFEGSALYDIPKHPLNRQGKGEGKVIGGNLSVLCGLRGTPYDYLWKNAILFIEDIGERAYHIERMLYNLKLGGVLSELSGLIIGRFTDCPEDSQLGHTLHQAIAKLVKEYDYPVLFDFPVGHVKENMPLPIGTDATLTVTNEKGTLEFRPF